MRVVLLKMNSNVYPLKNTNSHYLLLNTTIIPLCNGKISLIFFVRELQCNTTTVESQYLKPKDREHDSCSNQKLPSYPACKKSAQFIELFLS